MAASIEDVLLLKAQQEAANKNDNGAALVAGALSEQPEELLLELLFRSGQLINKLKDRLAAGQGLTRVKVKSLGHVYVLVHEWRVVWLELYLEDLVQVINK